jgi:serine beta-lactamase-like protein LACTB, mitochondrial
MHGPRKARTTHERMSPKLSPPLLRMLTIGLMSASCSAPVVRHTVSTTNTAGASSTASASSIQTDRCAVNASDIRRAIADVTGRQRNVGLSVAIRREGRIVFSEGFGFADLEDSVRVTPRTRFPVASVTKAFTGVALLKAAERGQIDLDAPIQRHVPTFPVKPGPAITPRLLAAHLAGIRHWGSERSPALFARRFDDVMDILPLFAGDTLVAVPGSRYSYSSYGYNLLAAAIQSAAGKPFQAVVGSQIFAALEMRDTEFDDPRRIIPHRARLYSFFDLATYAEQSDLVRVPDRDYSHNMAGGNLITTPEDLTRFGDALTRPGLLSSASLDRLYQRTRVGEVESAMSFGWFVGAEGEPRRIYINGANPGAMAGLYVDPSSRLVIALASNTWGRGSRSAEMTGGGPTDLPARIAAACSR